MSGFARRAASRWIASARADLDAGGVRGQLARGAAGTLALRQLALPLSLVTSIILARELGAHDFGLYVYVVAWASAIAIPVGMGLNEYVLREASRLDPPRVLAPCWSGATAGCGQAEYLRPSRSSSRASWPHSRQTLLYFS